MPKYSWPALSESSVLGTRPSRLDGPIKASGAARYSYDHHPPGMLFGKLLTCPHAHARILRLDTSKAAALAGVRAVRIIQPVGTEVQWAHDEIAAVAADTEEQARDAIRAIEVDYEVLPHYVLAESFGADPAAAPETLPESEESEGDPDAAFERAEVVVEGELGVPRIAHMCLEAHGQVAQWDGDQLTVHASTQGVSTLPGQFAEGLGDTPAAKVRIRCDVMGGGFGSKFSPDRWGIVGAQLARDAGAPVQLFLERDQEVAVAGSRPSSYARARVGVQRDGTLVAWESSSWGTGGRPGTGATPLPYVFSIGDRRRRHTPVPTHFASSRAWRAPNHPQACFVTMAMLDDAAAAIGMDPLDLFLKNLQLTPRPEIYREQLELAARKMDWRGRWRRRDERIAGPVQRGLGLSLHTWGGRGHASRCEVTVHSDGSVEGRLGTQDLGTGTRTIVAMVLAETFGLRLDQVHVEIGDSRFPQSGPSGGSSTVGGVTGSSRRAAQDALAELFDKVAPELGVGADELEARGGRIQVRAEPSRGLAFRDATALIGAVPIAAVGRNPGPGALNDSGVAGAQMADVSVDLDTGVVTMNKLVCVQDCGLVINEKLAESQLHSGLIMGIGYALYEELVPDPVTGRVLNPNMEFYRLPSYGDIGELDVHLMRGEGYEDRGVIGLGEPPVISPGAAISNAVANAIGVRVPQLPHTPDRVLAALASAAPRTVVGRKA